MYKAATHVIIHENHTARFAPSVFTPTAASSRCTSSTIPFFFFIFYFLFKKRNQKEGINKKKKRHQRKILKGKEWVLSSTSCHEVCTKSRTREDPKIKRNVA